MYRYVFVCMLVCPIDFYRHPTETNLFSSIRRLHEGDESQDRDESARDDQVEAIVAVRLCTLQCNVIQFM